MTWMDFFYSEEQMDEATQRLDAARRRIPWSWRDTGTGQGGGCCPELRSQVSAAAGPSEDLLSESQSWAVP